MICSNYLIIIIGGMTIIGIINQILIIREYSFIINIIGWIIVLYPIIIALTYFHKKKG